MARPSVAAAFLMVSTLVLAGCVGSKAESKDASVVEVTGDPIPDAGVIRGTVVDESLAPVAGAQVAVLDPKTLGVSDAGGSFRFQNLAPGTYQVAAAALGYDSIVKSVVVAANEETAVQFLLTRIAIAVAYVEFLGPYSWFFDCRVGTPVLTGPCGVSTPNDKSSQNFTMTDDVIDFVGEMRWAQGSFATSKALRMSFSYQGRPTTHWFCTATSPSPLQWHYNLPVGLETPADGCQTPEYCGIGSAQGVTGDHKVPTTKDQLIVYTNTPFGCASGADPTHAVELSLQQKLESAITIFHGEGKPEVYTAFPDT